MKIYQVVEKNGEKQLDSTKGSLIVDASLSATSKNPVQNKVVKEALDGKQEKGYYPTAKLATGTIDDLWEQVRYTSGCQGSISLQKKESGAGSELPGNTWFNYLYIPHRYGTNEDDNGNYGTIILTRLTTNGSSWIVRCTNGAVADAKYIVNGTEADMNALINKLIEGT